MRKKMEKRPARVKSIIMNPVFKFIILRKTRNGVEKRQLRTILGRIFHSWRRVDSIPTKECSCPCDPEEGG